MSWIRVSKNSPCIGCQKDSWCFISEDGLSSLCMRNISGKPYTFTNGDVGYIHRSTDAKPKYLPKPEPCAVHIDTRELESLVYKWSDKTKGEWTARLATELGVKASSLMELKVCWAAEHGAWCFPMRDGNGFIIGIRFRSKIGQKWSLTGSRNGLFYPWCDTERELWICEGGTDVAALRSLNLFGVGRPSCSGGMLEIKTLISRLGINRCYILADNDKPGLDGADSLVRNLPVPCCLMTLPTKDIRQYVAMGGDVTTLESMSRNVIWRNTSTA